MPPRPDPPQLAKSFKSGGPRGPGGPRGRRAFRARGALLALSPLCSPTQVRGFFGPGVPKDTERGPEAGEGDEGAAMKSTSRAAEAHVPPARRVERQPVERPERGSAFSPPGARLSRRALQ